MTIPATMRALQQTSLDGPQDTRLITDAPVPRPGAGEILIRVARRRRQLRRHLPRARHVPGRSASRPTWPVSKPPVRSSRRADQRLIGTRVVGVGDGAFAEYMVLPAVAAMPVPTRLVTRAGARPRRELAHRARRAQTPRPASPPGETVLIHAAAGATGQAAVTHGQALRRDRHRHRRAGQTRDRARVGRRPRPRLARRRPRRRGAAADRRDGVDLVLESAGGATFRASLAVARRVTGRVVVYGLAGGEAAVTNWELVYRHQVHAHRSQHRRAGPGRARRSSAR